MTPYEARTQSPEPERWRSASCSTRRGARSLLHLETRPAPVQEPRPQDGIQRHTGVGFELVLDPVVPQMAEQLVEVFAPAPAVFQASSSVVEHIASAPAVIQAPPPVVKFFAPLPAVFQASPVVEFFAPALAVVQSPLPVVEKFASAPAVVQSPSPVMEFVAPEPALSEVPAPGVESLSPAPVLSRWLAPGVDHFSLAPAVSHAARGRGLQGSVSGQSSTSRRRHVLPLPSGWLRVEDVSGRVYYWHVHTRQTRWTPPGRGGGGRRFGRAGRYSVSFPRWGLCLLTR